MSGKPLPMRIAEWLDSPTADPSRHHVLAAVREAYPDAAEMATAFVRVRPSEAWEAFLYGVMIERAITSEPQAHVLTPSEVALAKMLAAYLEWREADKVRYTADDESVDHMGGALEDECLLEYPKGEPTDKGRVLLYRARKAGVL